MSTSTDQGQVRKRLSLLILVLLLGFALRLFRLEEREIWYDEALAVLDAEKELGDIIYGTITRSRVQQQIYTPCSITSCYTTGWDLDKTPPSSASLR